MRLTADSRRRLSSATSPSTTTLPAEGTLTLSGGRQLEYVGHANTPEYFMVISEGGGIFAQASYAAVFTSLETAGEIAGLPGSVNDLVITLEPGADRDAFAAQLATAFDSAMPDIGVIVTNTDDDAVYTLMYEDIEGDQQFFNIIAILILGRIGGRSRESDSTHGRSDSPRDRDLDGARCQASLDRPATDADGGPDRPARRRARGSDGLDDRRPSYAASSSRSSPCPYGSHPHNGTSSWWPPSSVWPFRW